MKSHLSRTFKLNRKLLGEIFFTPPFLFSPRPTRAINDDWSLSFNLGQKSWNDKRFLCNINRLPPSPHSMLMLRCEVDITLLFMSYKPYKSTLNGGDGGRHDFVQNPTIDIKNVAFYVSFHKLLAKIVVLRC